MYIKNENKKLQQSINLNYKVLKKIIIGVTFLAFIFSIMSFIILLNIDIGDLKVSDSSSVAQLLPSFASIIIASIALYAYLKLEDKSHQQALKISRNSKKVIIILDTWLSSFALFKNRQNLKLFKSNILSHQKELEKLMYDGDVILLLNLIYKDNIEYRKKVIECIRDLTSFFDEIEYSEDKDFKFDKNGHIDNYPTRSIYRFLQNIDFIFKELKEIDTYEKVFEILDKLKDIEYKPSMLEELEDFKKSAGIRFK